MIKLAAVQETELAARIRDDDVVWVGAMSFEPRSIGSLNSLQRLGIEVSDAWLIDYSTNVRPEPEEKERRAATWQALESLKEKGVIRNRILEEPLHPYSYENIRKFLKRLRLEAQSSTLVFDVSCLTKIHAVALAASIAENRTPLSWCVAYSVPENYANVPEDQRVFGWSEILAVPLSAVGMLFKEEQSRGIVIPGHERDRLIVALGEVDLQGGVIVLINTPRRPDFRQASERRNKSVLKELQAITTTWTQEVVSLLDVDGLQGLINKEIDIARRERAPVVLFPYGPKGLVFVSALSLASEYPQGSWMVYPIPSGYDVNYTEGVGQTFWFGEFPS